MRALGPGAWGSANATWVLSLWRCVVDEHVKYNVRERNYLRSSGTPQRCMWLKMMSTSHQAQPRVPKSEFSFAPFVAARLIIRSIYRLRDFYEGSLVRKGGGERNSMYTSCTEEGGSRVGTPSAPVSREIEYCGSKSRTRGQGSYAGTDFSSPPNIYHVSTVPALRYRR